MKALRFFLSLIFASMSVHAEVFYRAPGVTLKSYQEALQTSISRRTPVDILQRRLQNEELPLFLQRRLDETLIACAKTPDRATEFYQQFLRDLEKEPRSVAIRESMQMVLERMMATAPQDVADRIQKRQKSLDGIGQSRPQKNILNQEIARTVDQLKRKPGGEDLVVFWNGVRWSSELEILAGDKAQWIFVSSQWKSRLIEGNWEEVSSSLQDEFLNWVGGDCQTPEFLDLSFATSENREAVYPKDCIANSNDQKQTLVLPTKSKKTDLTKPLLWGAAAMGIGLLLLQLSGKTLQFQR